MPRTRNELDRDAKVAEILSAAGERLLDGGYEALSVAAIARDLGLAQNAIYWYFPSKDRLLVAAVERLLAEVAEAKPPDVGKVERFLWFTDELARLSPVLGALRERARGSDFVAEFLGGLEGQLARMLSNLLRDRVPGQDLPVAVETIRATVQGAFARGLDAEARREVLTFALARVMEPPAGERS